jgi:hypothetical protein
MKLKLNPYAVLLTSGVLMLATVVLAQLGTGADLLKQGARSVDKDISSFAAKVSRSSDGELDSTSSPVAAEKERIAGHSHNRRVASR